MTVAARKITTLGMEDLRKMMKSLKNWKFDSLKDEKSQVSEPMQSKIKKREELEWSLSLSAAGEVVAWW